MKIYLLLWIISLTAWGESRLTKEIDEIRHEQLGNGHTTEERQEEQVENSEEQLTRTNDPYDTGNGTTTNQKVDWPEP